MTESIPIDPYGEVMKVYIRDLDFMGFVCKYDPKLTMSARELKPFYTTVQTFLEYSKFPDPRSCEGHYSKYMQNVENHVVELRDARANFIALSIAFNLMDEDLDAVQTFAAIYGVSHAILVAIEEGADFCYKQSKPKSPTRLNELIELILEARGLSGNLEQHPVCVTDMNIFLRTIRYLRRKQLPFIEKELFETIVNLVTTNTTPKALLWIQAHGLKL